MAQWKKKDIAELWTDVISVQSWQDVPCSSDMRRLMIEDGGLKGA